MAKSENYKVILPYIVFYYVMLRKIKTMKIHNWTVSEEEYKKTKSKEKIAATCSCGKTKYIQKTKIKNNTVKSCGCKTAELRKQTNLKKYGVENPFQSHKIKEQIKQTNLEKYGFENPTQSPKIKEQIKQTNLEKFGFEHLSQSPEIKEKKKQTSLEKFGFEYPAQAPEIKEKKKQTYIERYGVEHLFQSHKIKEQIKQTNLKKYCVEYPAQALEFKEKKKQTNLKKYGVEHLSQSPEFKEKVKQTSLEKFGFEHHFQSPEIQERIRKTYAENDYASKPEMEIRDWITEQFPHLTVKKSYCGGEKPCEIDILVKNNKGKNILAIEYNGDYFHSEARYGTKWRHLEKTNIIKQHKGCHTIHIFGKEWQEQKDQLKSFISAKLQIGVTKLRPQKCEFKTLTKQEAGDFCKQYHLQGKPTGVIYSLGCFYNNQLIAVMTFSKPHRQNMDSTPHLSRYVIKPGYRVYGGLSKMSKIAHKEIGAFITFVHLRLSDGQSYISAGYTLENTLEPDYFYWDSKNSKYQSKQSRRKSSVGTPPELTEREHAFQDGLYRIWDCGKLKLRFK